MRAGDQDRSRPRQGRERWASLGGAGAGPRRGAVVALLAYVATFVVLAAGLLPRFAAAVPAKPNFEDAHVLPWVLAWVTHALATAPGELFHANVAYPAPLQLTGTDPLLARQIGVAPLAAAGGNPVLAANLVAFLSYPLAAFAF